MINIEKKKLRVLPVGIDQAKNSAAEWEEFDILEIKDPAVTYHDTCSGPPKLQEKWQDVPVLTIR